jgi:two-component system, NarL family, nitrate/nitrite response regulator NarL
MIRVFIVADVRFYREGLTQALTRDCRFAVLGTAASCDEALRRTVEYDPDVVLIDTSISGGVSAVNSMVEVAPATKVVALAVTENEEDILEWARAGVAGYVPREASLEDLIDAVECVGRGELRCSAKIAASMFRRIASLSKTSQDGQHIPSPARLTAREGEIASLIEQGMSNKQIARHLNIGLATTKSHVHHILEKLNLHRRAEAAAWMHRAALGATQHPGVGRTIKRE